MERSFDSTESFQIRLIGEIALFKFDLLNHWMQSHYNWDITVNEALVCPHHKLN